MTGEFDIKNTKEMVLFGLSLGNGIGKAMANGTIDMLDVGYFFGALKAAGPAFKDVSLIPKEIGDIDSAELEDIKKTIFQTFDIPQDSIEGVIKKSLTAVLGLAELAMEFFQVEE